MKKVLLALLAIGALTMLGVSCSSSGSDDDEADGGTYFVSFKLDGKDYKFTKGLSKTESGTALTGEACAYYANDKLTILGFQNAYDASTSLGSGDYISIYIQSCTNTGTYTAKLVHFKVGNAEWEDTDDPNAVEVKITSYGIVGGVIEGTFTGKLTLLDENEEPTGTPATITEGVFKVVRAPDDAN